MVVRVISPMSLLVDPAVKLVKLLVVWRGENRTNMSPVDTLRRLVHNYFRLASLDEVMFLSKFPLCNFKACVLSFKKLMV